MSWTLVGLFSPRTAPLDDEAVPTPPGGARRERGSVLLPPSETGPEDFSGVLAFVDLSAELHGLLTPRLRQRPPALTNP
jgi:hypothetical protein